MVERRKRRDGAIAAGVIVAKAVFWCPRRGNLIHPGDDLLDGDGLGEGKGWEVGSLGGGSGDLGCFRSCFCKAPRGRRILLWRYGVGVDVGVGVVVCVDRLG